MGQDIDFLRDRTTGSFGIFGCMILKGNMSDVTARGRMTNIRCDIIAGLDSVVSLLYSNLNGGSWRLVLEGRTM